MQTLAMILFALAWQAGADSAAARAQAIQLATATLSSQLGVDAQAIQLVSADPVDWPDSSLGCPERGRVYMPVIVSGFRVQLQQGGHAHRVHTGGGRAVVCEGTADAAAPSAPRADAPSLLAVDRARRHLAAALQAPSESLAVKTVRPWRASDAACEPPPQAKAPERETRTESTFYVELTRGQETWRYRATPLRAWPCEGALRIQ